LLELYQIRIFDLCCKFQLNAEVALTLLQIVDERAILLNQVKLVTEEAHDEAKYENVYQ